jgi:hypothetical protein
MKKEKIIYWTATTIIALFEGVMPALTSQTELAKEGIKTFRGAIQNFASH